MYLCAVGALLAEITEEIGYLQECPPTDKPFEFLKESILPRINKYENAKIKEFFTIIVRRQNRRQLQIKPENVRRSIGIKI